MSDFDEQLRAALERGARDAPGTTGLAEGARRRLRVRRRRTVALAAAAAAVAVVVPTAVVAGGGDGQRPQPVGPTPGPEWFKEIEVTCVEGHQWPVSAMAGGLEDQVDEGELRAAFANLLQEAPMDAPEAIREHGFQDVPYVVLTGDDEEAVVGVGEWSVDGPGEDADYVRVERRSADLWAAGWGDCQLSVAVPIGRMRAEVSASPGGVDPATTEVTVLVREADCTSGRDPAPYLGQPEVVEQDDRVMVTVTSEAMRRGATCQMTPTVPIKIRLEEPLGDRELYDAGTWPPTPIEVAEEQQVVEGGVTVAEVPADWREFTCTWEDEGGGRFHVYGPNEDDACGYRTALAFYGAATFDPAHGPGEIVRGEDEGSTTWGGYVYSADGDTAVWVVTPERSLTQRILDGVDVDAVGLPCDPGMGSPEPRKGCFDPDPETGWLTMDGEGQLWFEPASTEEPQPLDLDQVGMCSGVIQVGYREPLEDHVVDCDEFRAVLASRETARIPVAIWSGSGRPMLQMSELYRP